MRRLALASLLSLAACASAPLALPDDALSRAATCSAVRTLELRAGRTGDGPISFDGFLEILHFPMLYAAEDAVHVDAARLEAARGAAPDVVEALQGQNWPTLVEPCNAAFPETQREPAALPGEPFEAGMTCFAIGDFLARTAPVEHGGEQRALAAMAERALAAAQPTLRVRAREDDEAAQRIANGYAARAFKAGRPAALIGQCRRRFPQP